MQSDLIRPLMNGRNGTPDWSPWHGHDYTRPRLVAFRQRILSLGRNTIERVVSFLRCVSKLENPAKRFVMFVRATTVEDHCLLVDCQDRDEGYVAFVKDAKLMYVFQRHNGRVRWNRRI